MGHLRLGHLPRTHRWKQVIGLLDCGADLPELVDSSFHASLTGLQRVPSDPGFLNVLNAIVELAQVSRQKDIKASLINAGIESEAQTSTVGFLSAIMSKLSDSLGQVFPRSDVGKIAQDAFIESLTRQVRGETGSLFGDVGNAKSLTAPFRGSQFKSLMHEFYSGFTSRYLSYHLSRELPHHVGGITVKGNNIDVLGSGIYGMPGTTGATPSDIKSSPPGGSYALPYLVAKRSDGSWATVSVDQYNKDKAAARKQVSEMLIDWLIGTGKSLQLFGPDSPVTQAMMNAPGVRELIANFIRDHYLSGMTESSKFIGFGLPGLWDAGSDLSRQFIGGYSVDIFFIEQTNRMGIRIRNITSFDSATYHITGWAWGRSSFPTMGNMEQWYYWSEDLPLE